MAEIVRYIYTVHLTWPTSLCYLVKRRCSKFLPNTGFMPSQFIQSHCIELVSKSRGHTVATIFLLRGHCQTCAGCMETGALEHRALDTVAFLERETRETRRRLGTCVRVRESHFEHEFW